MIRLTIDELIAGSKDFETVRGKSRKRLTLEEVSKIRLEYRYWGDGRRLAEKYGVSQTAISYLINGQTYQGGRG